MFKIKHKRIYSTITNYHINDENLSLSAKGLMTWFLCDVNSWDGSFDGILELNTNVDKETLLSTLNELQKEGYIELDKQNNYIINEKSKTKKTKKQSSKEVKEITEDTAKTNDKKHNLYEKCINFINHYTEDPELRQVLRDYLLLRLNPGVESRLNDRKLQYFNQWRGILLSLDAMSGNKKQIVIQSIENQWAKFVDLPKARDDIKSDSYTQEDINKFRQKAKEIEEKGGKGIF